MPSPHEEAYTAISYTIGYYLSDKLAYLDRLPTYSEVFNAVEDAGYHVVGDPGRFSDGSKNIATMMNSAWYTFHNVNGPLRSILTATKDPRCGIGSKETLGPMYHSDWTMAALWFAYRRALYTGDTAMMEELREQIRAYIALASLGIQVTRKSTAVYASPDLSGNWKQERPCPYFAASAAGRGRMSGDFNCWAFQAAVQNLQLALEEPVSQPTPWAQLNTPYWGMRTRKLLEGKVPGILEDDEKKALRKWIRERKDPSILLDLAGNFPVGPGGYNFVQADDGTEVTWLDRDPHGTKAAVMIGGFEANGTPFLISPVPYRGQGHLRSTARISSLDQGNYVVHTAPSFNSVFVGAPKIGISWQDTFRILYNSHTTTSPPPPPIEEDVMTKEETQEVLELVSAALKGANKVDKETDDQPAQRILRRECKRPLRQAQNLLEEALD